MVKKLKGSPEVKEQVEAVETPEALEALKSAVTVTDEVFAEKLASVQSTSEALQTDIQALALSALLDCSVRKDAIRINQLIRGLPDSFRKNGMRTYMERFGQVKFEKDSKQFSYDRTKRLNLWGANQKPWFKYSKEAEYKPFDLVQQAQALLVRATKKLESRKAGDKVTVEGVNKLGACIAEIKSLGMVA